MSNKVSQRRDTCVTSDHPHVWAVPTRTPGEPLYCCKGAGIYSWGLTIPMAVAKWQNRRNGVEK